MFLLLIVIAVAVVSDYSDRVVPKFSLTEKIIWGDFQGNVPKKYGMKVKVSLLNIEESGINLQN